MSTILLVTLAGCPAGQDPPVDGPDDPPTQSDASVPIDETDGSRSSPGNPDGVQTPVRFREITRQTGIDFTYRNGEETDQFAILESLGGGVGLCDFDRDGLLDICLPGGGLIDSELQTSGLQSGLYRQLASLQFAEAAGLARIPDPSFYTHGVAAADFDEDGFVDLLITGYRGAQLLHNLGDGTFEEVAEDADVADVTWSATAAWGDINGDGLLDLYVANYVDWSKENNPVCSGMGVPRDVCPPRQFEGLADQLYLNQGDGTFVEVSDDWELRKDGKGLGVLLADVDRDGRLDIYVCNDTVPNVLYRNVGDGGLEEQAMLAGVALNERGMPDGSMGVDLLDYNHDALPDLWVSNYENESHALYRNQGRGLFLHVSQSTGVTAVGRLAVGWGTIAFDVEHDGDEDVFVSNGHVIRFPLNAPLAQQPFFFENHDGSRFVDVASAAGDYMASAHRGRGAAVGDLDGDGDLDLVISHVKEPVSILLNESESSGDWLQVELIGTSGPRSAIGAVVELQVGDRTLTRQMRSGASYASTNESILHFGVPREAGPIELHVHWPGGGHQVIEVPQLNQRVRVVQESDTATTP
ncbi:CRTAC1 family protein [Maioricimonas rarisocia]|uniref:CRTAC1 family protein n=1 Tax=Maioricimonas rarisocia TaxID=2528026 RepID=UPI0018D232C2|nr:CRTAC1 family protein [Maioricimonas rarisocia]